MSGSGGRPTVAVDARALVARPAGIAGYTRSLLLALAASGRYRYRAMAHARPSGADELEAAGIGVEHQPAPLGVLWQQLRLPRRLTRGDLDLLWSPLGTLPARSPVPTVVTVHDLTPVLLPELHRLKVRWSMLPFLERSIAGAARVVADSRSTAADLARQFPWSVDKTVVVYPGVDPVFWPATAERVAEIRHELDAASGYLLAVGTLEPRKNLGVLVDAWETLRDRDPTFPPLVVAGGYGWRSRRLAARLESLAGHGLTWLGQVSPELLVELYQGALALAYPSLYEGFGLPPAEAMACGVPVVASDRASLPEVVGDAGLLVNPERPEELAHALRRLVAEPALRQELGRKGLERCALFRWERAAAEIEEVFAPAMVE